MLDDAGVEQEPRDIALPKRSNRRRLKIGEHLAKRRALPKDRNPTQAALKTLKHEFFKEPPVFGDRNAPLRIMVGNIQSIITAPPTAQFLIIL